MFTVHVALNSRCPHISEDVKKLLIMQNDTHTSGSVLIKGGALVRGVVWCSFEDSHSRGVNNCRFFKREKSDVFNYYSLCFELGGTVS